MPGSTSTRNCVALSSTGESKNIFGSWQRRSSIGIPKSDSGLGAVDPRLGGDAGAASWVMIMLLLVIVMGQFLYQVVVIPEFQTDIRTIRLHRTIWNASVALPRLRIAEVSVRNTIRRDPTTGATSGKNLSTRICALLGKTVIASQLESLLSSFVLSSNHNHWEVPVCGQIEGYSAPLNLRSSFIERDRNPYSNTSIHLVIPTHVPLPHLRFTPATHGKKREEERKKVGEEKGKYETLTNRRGGHCDRNGRTS